MANDYMRPIRDAADDITGEWADAFGADNVQRQAMRHALIEFAGSILDAVRAEAAATNYEANSQTLKDEIEMAQPLR